MQWRQTFNIVLVNCFAYDSHNDKFCWDIIALCSVQSNKFIRSSMPATLIFQDFTVVGFNQHFDTQSIIRWYEAHWFLFDVTVMQSRSCSCTGILLRPLLSNGVLCRCTLEMCILQYIIFLGLFRIAFDKASIHEIANTTRIKERDSKTSPSLCITSHEFWHPPPWQLSYRYASWCFYRLRLDSNCTFGMVDTGNSYIHEYCKRHLEKCGSSLLQLA